MRWIKKEPEVIPLGTRKVVRYFAWLPVTFYGETRWLEMVSVTKVYSNIPKYVGFTKIKYYIGDWVDYNFTDKMTP